MSRTRFLYFNKNATDRVMASVKKRMNKSFTNGEFGKKFIKAITSLIKKGISPVEGYGRFDQYSDSYKKAIQAKQIKGKKKISPVNLTKTGAMLKSMSFITRAGKLFFRYTDKKAIWHNDGEGNLPIRRIAPQEGESITPRLSQIIRKAFRDAMKKEK